MSSAKFFKIETIHFITMDSKKRQKENRKKIVSEMRTDESWCGVHHQIQNACDKIQLNAIDVKMNR